VKHNFVGRNPFQIPLGKRWSALLPLCHVVFFFVRPVFQSFLIAVLLHLAGGWKKADRHGLWGE
jgi:hypothetical protein